MFWSPARSVTSTWFPCRNSPSQAFGPRVYIVQSTLGPRRPAPLTTVEANGDLCWKRRTRPPAFPHGRGSPRRPPRDQERGSDTKEVGAAHGAKEPGSRLRHSSPRSRCTKARRSPSSDTRANESSSPPPLPASRPGALPPPRFRWKEPNGCSTRTGSLHAALGRGLRSERR